jgi:hypothetical protein
MTRKPAILLINALLLLAAVAGSSLQAESLTVTLMERYPEGEVLRAGQNLYLRIRYQSDEPVRFQAQAIDGGRHLPGVMMNPAPLYPAGEGEALAWIAFAGEAYPPRLEVHVSNHSWKTLTVMTVTPVPVWSTVSAAPGPTPDWVTALSDQQQQLTRTVLEQAHHSDGGDWLIFLMAWSVPGYFMLQGWVWWRWQPPWRQAGLLPLWASVPVTGYTLFALLMGSNLWPLVMLFVMPVLTIYLLAITVVRGGRE